jgi:hypothetical protein
VILGLGLFGAGALVGFLIGACRNATRVLRLEAEMALTAAATAPSRAGGDES